MNVADIDMDRLKRFKATEDGYVIELEYHLSTTTMLERYLIAGAIVMFLITQGLYLILGG